MAWRDYCDSATVQGVVLLVLLVLVCCATVGAMFYLAAVLGGR